MDTGRLRRLLEEVLKGDLSVDEALNRLRHLPFEDLGFAKVDSHRELRRGFPEVIYGPGKEADEIAAIAERIVSRGGNLLVTRVSEDVFRRIAVRHPKAVYHAKARAVTLVKTPAPRAGGTVLVLTAGTADIPVAEEACVTAEVMGNPVERIYDVGVAGIHRLLGHMDRLTRAAVLVVAAGMEGALPSVVGGLVARPVIAVPTSHGYGMHLGGLAPLLTMLNSCAAGVTVVNVDNGFGAGYAASLINHLSGKEEEERQNPKSENRNPK